MIDTVADADDIAVYVSNKNALGQTPYGSSTNFLAIPSGSYTGTISALSHGKTSGYLTPFQLDAEPSHRYTGIAVGNSLSWPRGKLVILDDDADQPAAGSDKASIKVVDAYPSSTKLDLIVDNIVAFSGLEYGTKSESIQLASGLCDTKVLEAGTYGDPMSGPFRMQLEPGKSYILVLLGQQTASQGGILIVPED